MRRSTLAFALVLALTPVARAEDALGPTSGERLLDEAVETTRKNWYDRAGREKIDWAGLKDRYRSQAREAATPVEAHHVVNRLFAELKTSHLALMEGTVYDRELNSEFKSKPTARAGFELVKLPEGFFAAGVLEGSPAEKAGIRNGDEVVTVGGSPTSQCPLLEDSGHDPGLPGPQGFVLRIAAEPEALRLGIRRRPNGPVEAVEFVPAPTSMLEAARTSVRIVEKDGKKLGVVHLWHFMNFNMAKVLRDAITGPLRKCDGLVLDVRGRGGNSAVIWEVLSNFSGESVRWEKPVVVLQDRGTRSAKEIFTWAWKKRGLGKVVGEKTAGAVIGCQFKKLFDGSVLMYPAHDVRGMTRGVQLEGNGIDPDVAVDPGPLAFRAGRDLIFEKGVEVLMADMKSSPRAKPRIY